MINSRRHPALACKSFGVLLVVLAITSCGQRGGDSERPTPGGSVPKQVHHFDPLAVDGEGAMDQVRRFIAISPRTSGTDGAAAAAQHIADRLKALGLEPATDTFLDTTIAGEVLFRNVVAMIEGSGDGLIVIGSHYDTKAGIGDAFQGANDSGSSTGLLLELARVFKAGPKPPASIVLAFLDGEECVRRYGRRDGLHGSRRFAGLLSDAGRARRVRAVIILDMIGDRDLGVALPRNCTARLCSLVFDVARDQGVRSSFMLGKQAVLDDHVPFIEKGMPAVNLIDFQFGSAPGLNDYWHTTEDSIDKISAESLQSVGKVTVALVNRLLADDMPKE
jgi:glutaminyl-peptide cyclotransferase